MCIKLTRDTNIHTHYGKPFVSNLLIPKMCCVDLQNRLNYVLRIDSIAIRIDSIIIKINSNKVESVNSKYIE